MAVRVRKVLDAADVQGDRDMSGFEFELRNAEGDAVTRLVTGADGRTPVAAVRPGSATVHEVARPGWASVLVDGAPIAIELGGSAADREGKGETTTIDYVNVVPEATITTRAHDDHDGDRVVELDTSAGTDDATIVDVVTHAALVPGTPYVVRGELMVRATDPATPGATGAPRMIPTGIVATTAFVPDQPDGSVEVRFTLPADTPLGGHVVVVYQQLTVASSGRVVAVHADPDAAEQTLRIAQPTAPPTTAPPTTAPPTAAPPTTAPPTTAPPSSATTVPATPAPTTAPPIPPASPTPPARPTLPRTGGTGVVGTALVGLALLALGTATIATSRRRHGESHDA